MAWRVDPFGDKIDWIMKVSTEYRKTGCLSSRDGKNVDKKLSEYVTKVLKSWMERGGVISHFSKKDFSSQMVKRT